MIYSKYKLACLYVFLHFFYGCTLPPKSEERKLIIATGSCSRQNNDNQLWKEVISNRPGVFIWTGDIIYGDSHDMSVLKEKYDQQKNRSSYQELLDSIQVIGVWDDHDYGVNDGGKLFSRKKESKELLLEFLDYDKSHEVREHEGMYHSLKIGQNKDSVAVILLDTRYFRDTVYRDTFPVRSYLKNETGDILGGDQWNWLEAELKKYKEIPVIIVSSIQFLSSEHRFEKWANFPASKQRMLDLLSRYPNKYLFISGDRHISEVSAWNDNSLDIYEFTSSGLTHSWESEEEEPNQYRVSNVVHKPSFGLIEIDFATDSVYLSSKGKENELLMEYKFKW